MRLAFLTSVGVSLTSLILFSTVPAHGASIPRADDWQIAGPYGGSATAIAVDSRNPQILLAGARQSLLYKSDDYGNSWTLLPFPKRAFGQVDAILIDPQDSQHYLIALSGTSDAGLFVSTDSGHTWTASNTLRGFTVRALAASASEPGRFVAGTTQGVYLSSDAGNTWSRISDPMNLEMLGVTAVAIDPQNPQIIYAGTTHLPWKTIDGGKTWESIHSGMINDSDVFSIFIDPHSPDRVFASACSGIYQSANRGDVWKKILGIPNTSRRTHVIRLDPSAPGTIYAGTTMGLFRSSDAGGTWRQLNEQQVNSLAFGPAKADMYLALEEGGLWKSDDQGKTLAPLNNGFVARRLTAVTSAGKRLFAIQALDGESTGLFTSDNAGATWQRIPSPAGLAGVHLESITGIPGNDQTLFAASRRQLFQSTDSGRSWKPVSLAGTYTEKGRSVRIRTAKGRYITRERTIEHTLRPSAINSLSAIASGTQTVLFAASDRGLLRSTDKGVKWMFVNAGLLTPFSSVSASPANDGRLIARSNLSLYFSRDFGDTWKTIGFPLETSQINAVAVPPANSSSRLLAATFRGLYSSKDDGQTWSIVSSGLPISTVESVIYSHTEPNVAYAVEFGQLYQSKDGGVQWSAEPSTFRALQIRQLWQPAQLPDRLFAVTNDIGILFRNQAFIR